MKQKNDRSNSLEISNAEQEYYYLLKMQARFARGTMLVSKRVAPGNYIILLECTKSEEKKIRIYNEKQ